MEVLLVMKFYIESKMTGRPKSTRVIPFSHSIDFVEELDVDLKIYENLEKIRKNPYRE